jgi:hypothetical protein
MVDLPGRKEPRFPPQLEPRVRQALRERIHAEVDHAAGETVRGYASMARGGDILFHEICRALRLDTTVVLPFPPERFVETSVDGAAAGDWPARFFALWNATPAESRHVLDLPDTTEAYAACNRRILELAADGGRLHLLALWDGAGGDGPGGTADLVGRARAAGDEPTVVDPRAL